MTTKDEALRMAIEALDNQQLGYSGHSVRKACQEALAETQEPVARINVNKRRLEFVTPMDWSNLSTVAYYPDIDLYTTPRREWQCLSDEEILRLEELDCVDEEYIKRFAHAIEAKLREKNNG